MEYPVIVQGLKKLGLSSWGVKEGGMCREEKLGWGCFLRTPILTHQVRRSLARLSSRQHPGQQGLLSGLVAIVKPRQ